jgi:hypothetical protein
MERWSERRPGALSSYWGLNLRAVGTLTGLWYREATGQGQHANASMSPAAHAIWGRPFSCLPLRRVAVGPLSWPAQRPRLRGSVRDEPSGYGKLYCRRCLLLVEPACYEGRGHGAA